MLDLGNWQNPATLMVNLMNAALGLAVLLLAAGIGWRLFRESRRTDKDHGHKGNHP
jgi:hypothetical protein